MSDAHDELVERVGKAPDREWIEDFFSLLNDLLSYEEVDVHESEDRLVTSLQDDRLAVTMNSRYVLTAYLNDHDIGFIVRRGSERVEDLVEAAAGHGSFNSLPGEDGGQTPDWVRFEDASALLTDEAVHQNWLTTASIEFDRWTASPYRGAHEPLVERAAMDEEYRDDLLTEAFAERAV